MGLSTYARAIFARKTGLAAGATIPLIERREPARRADPKMVRALRGLFSAQNDGFLPVTYPYAAAFRSHLANLVAPEFPFPLMGTVHLRMEIEQKSPLPDTAHLAFRNFMSGHRETDQGIEFDLVTEVAVDGERLWRGVATMLRRKARGDEVKRPPKSLPLDGVGAQNVVLSAAAKDARRYAFLSGDLNPIHLSSVTAKLFGFRTTVMHGMWSLGRVAALHPGLTAQPNLRLACQFKLPLHPARRLVYRHWPTGSEARGGIEFRLLNAKADAPHLSGTFTQEPP